MIFREIRNEKSIYRNELNGLRAFAILAVIINHFNKEILPGGYLGVDIFFVISGYVITSSLSKKNIDNFWAFIYVFFKNRIKRLLPALITFIFIITFLFSFFSPEDSISLKTAFTSLFGFSNLYLFKISTDYFASSTELNPFTHTWSLGVEEQFYILFPLIIFLTGFRNGTRNGSKNFVLTLLLLGSASLISFLIFYENNASAVYFLMPFRFWEIASGCLLFTFIQRGSNIRYELSMISPTWVLILIILLMNLPQQFVVIEILFTVILTLILISCLRKGTFIYKIFTNQKIVYIGLISYSLYLWHWGILSISRLTIGIHWWSIPFQIGLIFYAAKFSYKFIENPLRKNNWSNTKWESLLKFIISLLIPLLTLIGLEGPFRNKLYLGSKINYGNPLWSNEIMSASERINGRKCHMNSNFTQKELKYLIDDCRIINPKNSTGKTVAFIGDSHTLALMEAQKKIFNAGYNLLHYSYGGCPFPYPLFGIKRKIASKSKLCNQILKNTNETIFRELKKDDIVIISNYHLSYLGDHSLRETRHFFYDENGYIPTNGDEKIDIYTNSLKEFSKKAQQKGIKIILIGAGTRNFYYKITSAEWFRPFPPNYIFDEERLHARELNEKLKNKLKDLKNFIFFDTLEEIPCCKNHTEYMLLYRDTNHLSKFGANFLIDKLIQKL